MQFDYRKMNRKQLKEELPNLGNRTKQAEVAIETMNRLEDKRRTELYAKFKSQPINYLRENKVG